MADNFYRVSAQETMEQEHTGPTGLTDAQAQERLTKFGLNKLTEKKRKSTFVVFLEQFKDLLVAILIVAAIISMLSGQTESAFVIFAVLLLNAVLGTVQYVKAEKSLASLKAMSSPTAKVLRHNNRIEIPAEQIVPGDILLLESGDLVAADGRMLENFSLKVNESSLTGESVEVEKTIDVLPDKKAALGDQKNMVFSGSLVTYGRASVIVTGTGMHTELGRIAALMDQTQQHRTPLQKSLDEFSKKLSTAIIAICIIVFLLSVLRTGMSILSSLMFAVALAVAAIPEALGSIVTIVQAIGTQKMAKQHAIIKDLKAVETLGSVSVICSDKTGTLTQNRMTVQKIYADHTVLDGKDLDLANHPQHLLLKTAILASDATVDEKTGAEIGDPTEIALVNLGGHFGVEETTYRSQHPRLRELAFDSERKLMSTLHQIDGKPTLLTKGAPDVLLQRSTKVFTSKGVLPLGDKDRAEILNVNQQLSAEGLRVLAFGYRELSEVRDLTCDDEKDFIFIGLISMIDPPRAESVQAVADAKRAGIRTVMITGDHKATATAVAKRIGIFEDGDMALNGMELDSMTDQELDEKLPKVSVYARVSPEHKIRIVSAWQRRGCIVSMTGDGVNDAPALRQANIGVAMGITGTEVSKDAASMILSDDNFATIVKAVVNGRSVFTNIRNSIQFLLSGNMSAILCVLYTSLMMLPVPFAPVQLLFINLLTDSLPAIAIGMEPAHRGLLDQRPRNPKESILNKNMFLKIFGQGLLIGICVMAAYYSGYGAGGSALACTMAFATLTLARLFHGFNCRGKGSVFQLKLFSNPYSLLAFFAGAGLLALVLLVPFMKPLFLVTSLSGRHLLQIVLLAFAPTLVIQLYKVIRERTAG